MQSQNNIIGTREVTWQLKALATLEVQHPQDSLQWSVTLVPGDLAPSSSLRPTHAMQIYMQTKHLYIKNKIICEKNIASFNSK